MTCVIIVDSYTNAVRQWKGYVSLQSSSTIAPHNMEQFSFHKDVHALKMKLTE